MEPNPTRIDAEIGDRVFVWKFVLDTEYQTTGTVEKISHDERTGAEYLYVNGDWYKNANDMENKCEFRRRP